LPFVAGLVNPSTANTVGSPRGKPASQREENYRTATQARSPYRSHQLPTTRLATARRTHPRPAKACIDLTQWLEVVRTPTPPGKHRDLLARRLSVMALFRPPGNEGFHLHLGTLTP